MQRVDTEDAAAGLADRLNGSDRDHPVVVVTTPLGRLVPWIDVDEIEREVGDLAEVVVLPTGRLTWSFTRGMPAMTQVFGGAGRVYPVGHAWVADPKAAPLRLARDEADGRRATDRLIDDAMWMAAQAGLTTDHRERPRTRLEGVVSGIVADRALVKLVDRHLGIVSPAHAVPTLDVDRVLVEGQRVVGWYDETSRWFDVREMVLAPDDAMAAYRVGDVVLALAGEVLAESAVLFVHPRTPVTIGRDEVTGNDLDDLRTLLTRGEVVPARVTATGPGWRLSLLDVDDDEEPAPAAALIAGGPPWLTPRPNVGLAPHVPDVVVELPVLEPEQAPEPGPAHQPQQDVAAAPAAPAASAPPTPWLLDRHRRDRERELHSAPAPPLTPAPAPAAAPTHAASTVGARELGRAREEVGLLHTQLDGLRQEIRLVLQERASLESRIGHLEKQLTDQRVRLRKAKRPSAETSGPVFADAEQGFRHAVLTAWATRTPVAEQAAVPLPSFAIGHPFLPSLERLEGVTVEKVADVVFEVVTDRAKDIKGREQHRYRASEGGGAPAMHRPQDGAVLWRVNLQTNSSSARRMHFWRGHGGDVELWHVGVHDDRPPPP